MLLYHELKHLINQQKRFPSRLTILATQMGALVNRLNMRVKRSGLRPCKNFKEKKHNSYLSLNRESINTRLILILRNRTKTDLADHRRSALEQLNSRLIPPFHRDIDNALIKFFELLTIPHNSKPGDENIGLDLVETHILTEMIYDTHSGN